MADVTDLQLRVQKFLKEMGWDAKDKDNKYYGLIHFMEELGEFSRELLHAEAEQRKNHNWRGDTHPKEKLEEELADLLYHCFRMAVLFDVDLDKVFDKKMRKIEERYLKMRD